MAKKYQLKNGMNVLLLQSHKSPVVSVQMWVKTGSADEQKNIQGISHFIEHLVFKGTEKYKVGEIASVVEAAGGELNAYTSFDQTVFYVTISKQFADTALDVISQMMGSPTFDPVEIDNEREVVIEEIKRGQDSPSRSLSQQLFSNMFKKHPYGIPVIGYEKIIKKVTPKQIKAYFNSRYVPSNMFLVIAGDFEQQSMKEKVQRYFGSFENYKLAKVRRIKEPKSKKLLVDIKQTNFQQTSFYLSWRIPKVSHEDGPVLDVLSMVLGAGDSSRLVERLRIQSAIVNSIGSFSYAMQDDGLFAISASVEPQNLIKTIEIITEELVRIIQEPPRIEELQKIITNLASHEIYSLETVDNIARKAGTNEFYYGDHNYFKKYLKAIYSIKPEEITAIARKYLKPDCWTFTLMSPLEKKKIQSELKTPLKMLNSSLGLKKHTLKKVKFKPTKINLNFNAITATPKIQTYKTKEGMTLIMRKQSDTPTVSAKMAFFGGVRIEPDGFDGLTELFSRNWMSGTVGLSEMDITKKLENIAAGMSPFGGRNSVGVSTDFLSKNEDEILSLFEEVVLHPTFPESELAREKTIILNQIKKRNDNPAQICMLNFSKQIFKGHPYSKDMLGNPESIQKISRHDLQNYYKSIARASNGTLCVIGDFDESKWKKFADRLSKALSTEKFQSSTFDYKYSPLKETIYQKLDKEQNHIVVGYPGLRLDDNRRFALEIIQSILSGQGGRLFVELRDKNSLAYTVSPLNMYGIECGYFGGYIGCSPEKSEKAIKMLIHEFKHLIDERVSEVEIERARKYIVGRHDIDLQRKSAVCNSILFDAIYGLDPHRSLDVAKDYESVTAEMIQELARDLFDREPIISVVGKY